MFSDLWLPSFHGLDLGQIVLIIKTDMSSILKHFYCFPDLSTNSLFGVFDLHQSTVSVFTLLSPMNPRLNARQ